MRRVANVLLVLLPGVLALDMGCTTSQDPTRMSIQEVQEASRADHFPVRLQPFLDRMRLEGESNQTLNRMRLASAALQQQEWSIALDQLHDVLDHLEKLGPADNRSRKALDTFTAEEIKQFKGEPYERSMAYFLQGLIYMHFGQWDNARACFKSVQLEDVSAVHPENQADWASAYWLEGYCNHQLGQISQAEALWKHASELAPRLPDHYSKKSHLCVGLLGRGPIKYPAGTNGDRLAYANGLSVANSFRVKNGSTEIDAVSSDILLAQATGRGLREMDQINQGKTQTREGLETAGQTLMILGAGTAVGGTAAKNDSAVIAGLGAATAGVISQGVAASIHPKADTRTWDLLPASIQILVIPGESASPFSFEIMDSQQHVLRKGVLTDSSSESYTLIIEP